MKLSYHGANSAKSDLTTDVKASAQAGFKVLELWAAKLDQYLQDHSLAEMKALFRDHHIEPGPINSIEFIAFRNAADYEQIQNRCRRLSEIAEGIGGPSIIVVPSPTPHREGELFFPWEEVVQEYVKVLQDLGAIAQPHGVQLSFEFLGFAWCSVRTPRATYEIVRKTNRENVGMTLDTCHFFGCGGDLREIDALDPKRLLVFHLDDIEDGPKEAAHDSRRLIPGEGIIPLDDICSHLKGIGFDGHCSIELFRPEYWEWDPYELASAIHKAAVKVLSPYFALA